MNYLNLNFKKLITFFMLSILAFSVFGQNLMDERIRRISPRKKSIYLERGVFHNGGPKRDSELKALRHNFSKKNGYERLVFDFKEDDIPRIYGYISGKERRIYIDLFDTKIPSDLGAFGNSKFVESINFFPIQKETLSIEIILKKDVSIDIFYLKNNGRFVVDIKG